METPFTKMQGLGNDFVVFDALSEAIDLTPDRVRQVADRRFGIGCDQVLLIEPAHSAGADIRYRIFNADGHEVEQCGNGSRCIARYLSDHGLLDKEEIVAETVTGVVRLYREPDGHVRVNMGVPRLAPQALPMLVTSQAIRYPIEVGDQRLSVSAVSLGNPHAVLQVDDVDTVPVVTLGQKIASHRLFPQGVNVGFMQILDRSQIRLRVYERGVGETLACGTGACAAVVAGTLQSLLDKTVYVELPGGRLTIRWEGGDTSVWMTGPATRVFEGRIEL